MSSDTLSTTFRVLNHFWRPWATSPSIASVVARRRHGPRRLRRAAGAVVLRIEDRLHALLIAALDDGPVLRQEDRDRLAADDVVVLPDAGVADQDDALIEV